MTRIRPWISFPEQYIETKKTWEKNLRAHHYSYLPSLIRESDIAFSPFWNHTSINPPAPKPYPQSVDELAMLISLLQPHLIFCNFLPVFFFFHQFSPSFLSSLYLLPSSYFLSFAHIFPFFFPSFFTCFLSRFLKFQFAFSPNVYPRSFPSTPHLNLAPILSIPIQQLLPPSKPSALISWSAVARVDPT